MYFVMHVEGMTISNWLHMYDYTMTEEYVFTVCHISNVGAYMH